MLPVNHSPSQGRAIFAKINLNARLGAISLVGFAVVTIFFAIMQIVLLPTIVFMHAVFMFGVWALCDEMGVRKPLVRAGLVTICFAVFGRVFATLQLQISTAQPFYILFVFMALLGVLFLSAAFLHRSGTTKVVGSFGLAAGILPLGLLLGGHIIVGFGAFFGVASLYGVKDSFDLRALANVDIILAAWSFCAGMLLLTGNIKSEVPST